MYLIQAKNLKKVFKTGSAEIHALKNVSFEVSEGEFLAITGKSGSGKSTLLYQLGLLDHPTSGEIILNGINTEKLNHEQRIYYRLKELGYIFQDYALLPSLTAMENVSLPLLMQGLTKKRADEKAKAALKRMGLEDRMDNLPSQLSGGQQQRVAIARAICHDPKIIFADEPTANLDTETSKMVLDAFLDLHRDGQTIVMVTHEKEYARLAGRIIELADGEMVKDSDG